MGISNSDWLVIIAIVILGIEMLVYGILYRRAKTKLNSIVYIMDIKPLFSTKCYLVRYGDQKFWSASGWIKDQELAHIFPDQTAALAIANSMNIHMRISYI